MYKIKSAAWKLISLNSKVLITEFDGCYQPDKWISDFQIFNALEIPGCSKVDC